MARTPINMARTVIPIPRTAAGNRLVVRNFPYCLDILNGTQVCSWGNVLFSSDIVSVAFLFKPRKTGSSSFDVQLGYSNSRWYFLYNGASRKLGFIKKSSSVEGGSGYLTNNLDIGKWYVIIGTYDKDAGANNLTFAAYNANTGLLIERKTATSTGAIDSTAQVLRAGYDSNRSLSVNAQFQDVHIYNRVLSVAEQDAYALGYEPVTTSLQLHGKLIEGTGTNVADSSGNDRVGTLSGSATWATDTICKARTVTP